MEHVNDDMDNLFRKAGELYPLKTSESDWDGVLGKLRDEISGETGTPFAVPSRGNSNRSRWLLLLLVPAAIFGLFYFSGSRVSEKTVQSASRIQDQPDSKKTGDPSQISSSAGQANNKNIDKLASTLNSKEGISSGTPGSSTENSSGKQAGMTAGQKGPSANNSNGKDILSEGEARNDAGNQNTSALSNSLASNESFREPVKKALFLSVYGMNENPSVYVLPFPSQVSKEISLNSETAKTATKTKTDKVNNSRGIYAVALGGPDLSTVSRQSTEQAGYSLGILLGYRFNKRISLETGLLWDKKNYYSGGEYFDKSKTSISNYATILNLNGYCQMFEIPLSLRYDFATGRNHSFFATTGLSSYIMKKEYYDYNAWVDDPRYPPAHYLNASKPYYNSGNYFLSIVQMSAGYEFAIGTNTRIRIEPYVKIPLQGIGIGSMRISSGGLYFGISHSFH